MKNFRKVLALILVVATLFSFVAMASAKNAEDYTDYAEVTNKEAVDVLSALGINEGHDDGSFTPNKTIDRDEVAAMIARLNNGGDFDASIYVGSDDVFADVKGQWSEGYVTYCATIGAVNGRNASTFDPNGKVTGVETLKMLLCTLGYKADKQGYTGANWQTNVVRDAKKMDLLVGLEDVNLYAPATRDQVAQMFLNALNAYLVYGYIGEGIVELSNSLLEAQLPHWINIPDNTDDDYERAYCNAIISRHTLGCALGVVSEPARDCFGRPGHSWYIGGVFFKSYWDAPIAKYTTEVDFAADYEDEYEDFYYWHNGNPACNEVNTGNGVLTEVYADGTVVIIDTYMSVVKETHKRNGWAQLANSTEFDNSELNAEIGDVVLYTACDGSCGSEVEHDPVHRHCGLYVHAVEIIEPILVEVEDVHRMTQEPKASYFTTADGKTYEYALYLSHEVPVSDEADKDIKDKHFPVMDWSAKGTEKLLYLDKYGYVMYYANPETEKAVNVGYFVENTNTAVMNTTIVNNGYKHEYDYSAEVVGMDAQNKGVITTDAAIYEAMGARYYYKPDQITTQKLGMLASYYEEDGSLKTKATVAKIDTYIDAAKGELVGEHYSSNWNGPTEQVHMDYHFNADTNYLVRTLDFATGEYSYEAVAGYKAIEQYVGKVVIDNLNSSDLVAIPTIQYLDEDEDGIIENLFVDAFYKKTTGDYVYVLEMTENIGLKALGKIFPAFDLYKGIVNGEEAYVAYYGIGASEPVLKSKTLYQTTMQAVNASYQGKPIYVALEEADELNLTDLYYFQGLVVENGQIALVEFIDRVTGDYTVVERLNAAYNDDLTVIVVPAGPRAEEDLGVAFGVYTGTEFIEEFVTDEWITGKGGKVEIVPGWFGIPFPTWTEEVYGNVYAIEENGEIVTLIIELG